MVARVVVAVTAGAFGQEVDPTSKSLSLQNGVLSTCPGTRQGALASVLSLRTTVHVTTAPGCMPRPHPINYGLEDEGRRIRTIFGKTKRAAN